MMPYDLVMLQEPQYWRSYPGYFWFEMTLTSHEGHLFLKKNTLIYLILYLSLGKKPDNNNKNEKQKLGLYWPLWCQVML